MSLGALSPCMSEGNNLVLKTTPNLFSFSLVVKSLNPSASTDDMTAIV